MITRLKPCPFCHDAWMYVSDGDCYSGHESCSYRVGCRCGWAWKHNDWQKTREDAIKAWNEKVRNYNG